MSSRQRWSALEERRHNDDHVLSGPAVFGQVYVSYLRIFRVSFLLLRSSMLYGMDRMECKLSWVEYIFLVFFAHFCLSTKSISVN
jgi:hypothetical protein